MNNYCILIDTETHKKEVRTFDTPTALFVYASRLYCFDDLDDTYTIAEMAADGVPVSYVGWQPGMVFEYEDEQCNIVWSCDFPDWDH